jgi:hypothetical protein
MAILFGTQSNGETLPVQVNEFGQLVAKGIDGPAGPPGPPGIGQLPADPYEGALLGWENGELAWVGSSIVLPAGTYGPYRYVAAEERLEIPQNASSLVNGQQIYMSDNLGTRVVFKALTDTIANVSADGLVLTFPSSFNFDRFTVGDVVQGDAEPTLVSTTDNNVETWVTEWNANNRYDSKKNNMVMTWSIPGPASVVFGGYRKDDNNVNVKVSVNGTEAASGAWGKSDGLISVTLPSGNNTVEFQGDQQYYLRPADSKIDGSNFLINQSVQVTSIRPSTNQISTNGGSWLGADGSGEQGGATVLEADLSGDGSVFVGGNGSILLRTSNKEWVDDFYVTAPEQRIAARKIATTAIRTQRV